MDHCRTREVAAYVLDAEHTVKCHLFGAYLFTRRLTPLYRLGFDIGGTFTDFVLLDEATGNLYLHKCLTTYPDPSAGALQGLQELAGREGIPLAEVAVLIHGTTLVTNTIIERRGAKLGLLTTRGFRDILAMGKEQRYDVYDLFLPFPEPLAPRRWRLEIDERITATGDALKAPDPDQVRAAVRRLVDDGVEAVAVAFLHSYRNPAHERLVRDLIRNEFPGLYVSISSDVVPEVREYERAVTTAANTYVQPLMRRYLDQLEAALRAGGFAGQFYLMQSSGGSASPAMAKEYPIRLLESGPAAGALVTAFFGRLIGRADLLAFDMGGTTAKAALIQDGKPAVAPMLEAARVHRFKRGSGLPIKAPVVDLIEIGAGGGSIARVGQLGTLQVGPDSAAADPGPACYGLGGTEPTVTDANVVLGYLNPDYFLGGRMKLDLAAARQALEVRLAGPLGLSLTEAAWGVYSVVNENMAAAARVHIIEQGSDPRRYAMVAFGGAGPVHAARVVRVLGMSEVIVPQAAGAASALGLLVAPISFEIAHSYPVTLEQIDWAELSRLYADMAEKVQSLLTEAGVPSETIRFVRTAEMRLLGQVHEITVPVPDGDLGPDHLPELAAAFKAEYERLYSLVTAGHKIQALNWRLLAAGPAPGVNLTRSVGTAEGQGGPEFAYRGARPVYFPETGGYISTPVYDRYKLAPGSTVTGPAVVEERESTTVAGPGDVLTVDSYLNLVIRVAVVKEEQADVGVARA